MVDALILPIGHYLGANYPSMGAELDSHVVRVGWQLHRLERIEQFAVWALAHGLPEGGDMAPWTRAATEGAARASGIPGAGTTLAELADLELIVEVAPGTSDARELAKLCRVRALLCGMGDVANSSLYGIGWAGGAPVVSVDSFTYELWKWGPACDSLWHMCEMLAHVEAGFSGPDEVLARALPAVQVLLAHGAAFLDEAREQWELEPMFADTSRLSD